MNTTKVYLVSADYIKQNSPIIDDIENTLLTSHIIDAQNIDLQTCLGEDLYDYIITSLETFTEGQSVETLLGTDVFKLYDGYIKPFLKQKVIYYAFYDLFAKNTAKGLVTQTSGNSATVDLKILENMRKQYQIKAEFYKESMTEYITDNLPDYAIASCESCADTNLSGLYLGKVDW